MFERNVMSWCTLNISHELNVTSIRDQNLLEFDYQFIYFSFLCQLRWINTEMMGKNMLGVGWKMSGNVLSVQRSINQRIINYEIPIENNLPSPRDRNQLGPRLISKTQEHSFSIRMIIFLCSLLFHFSSAPADVVMKKFYTDFQFFFSSVSPFPQKVFFSHPSLFKWSSCFMSMFERQNIFKLARMSVLYNDLIELSQLMTSPGHRFSCWLGERWRLLHITKC